MDYKKQIEKIYEDLNEDKIANATMKCFRLESLVKDYLHAASFFRGLSNNEEIFIRAFYVTFPKKPNPVKNDSIFNYRVGYSKIIGIILQDAL
jgi:hypothetical protein